MEDTLKALDLGTVEDLIIWENLVMRNTTDGATSVAHLLKTKESKNNDDHLKCHETGAELDVIETEPLVDWMANNYKHFDFKLEFVTDWSREGTQFTKGFSGIGGILRWKVDFVELTITTAIRTTTTTIAGSTTMTLASKFGESPTRQSHFV